MSRVYMEQAFAGVGTILAGMVSFIDGHEVSVEVSNGFTYDLSISDWLWVVGKTPPSSPLPSIRNLKAVSHVRPTEEE